MSEPTFQEAVQAVQGAMDELAQAAKTQGATVDATPDLTELKDAMGELVSPEGKRQQAKVSKAGTIYRGDQVTLCREFDAGDLTRFAVGDVKVLAAASALDGLASGPVWAVLFGQNGATKLKVFTLGPKASLRMSNTVTVAEDETLEWAALCGSPTGKEWYVLYNRDSDGLVTAVTLDTRTFAASLGATDIWMAGGDPENIVGTVNSRYGYLHVCCTRLPAGSIEDDDREAVLLSLKVTAAPADSVIHVQTEAVLAPEAYPGLHGIQYARDAYAQGWGLAAYGDTLYLTYPKPNETGRGMVVAEMAWGNEGGRPIPLGFASCAVEGSIPSAMLAPAYTLERYGAAGGCLLAHGVTRLNEESPIKSLLGLELWVRQTGDARPTLLWLAEDDMRYAANISRVCCGHLGSTGGFTGYANGHTMYGQVVTYREDGAVGGPTVALGTFQSYAAILPLDEDRAVYVYQQDGNGYVKLLGVSPVAAGARPGHADGTAMTGGRTGSEITVKIGA